MAAMKTILALTAVFVCVQYVHIWAASTESPDVTQSGGLQFRKAQTLSIEDKTGNLRNHKICNRQDYIPLAQEDGVLVVQCGTDLPLPAPTDLIFNITVTIPKNTTTLTDNEIQKLFEIKSKDDPEAEINIGENDIDVRINGVDGNTILDIFF